MSRSVFNTEDTGNVKEPIILGNSGGVASYTDMTHPIFDKLTEKQLSFFGDQRKSMFLEIGLTSMRS